MIHTQCGTVQTCVYFTFCVYVKWQEASPANINTLSPEPDDDDDDDVNNNDVDDDVTSPLNATGGFVELTLPADMQQDASETFDSTAELTDSFYSE